MIHCLVTFWTFDICICDNVYLFAILFYFIIFLFAILKSKILVMILPYQPLEIQFERAKKLDTI